MTESSNGSPQPIEEELHKIRDELAQKTLELARSLAMMRATLDATSEGILATDVTGRMTAFNENFSRMWSVPRDTLETGGGFKLVEFMSQYFRDPVGFRARIEEVLASSTADSRDILHIDDGRVIERHSRVVIIENKNVGRVWSFRDISQQRRLEEARFRLAAIVESSNDAIVSKTLDGRVTSWNDAAARLFGYSATEMIGQPIAILIPPGRIHEEQQILDKIRRGERLEHYESVRMRKDGTTFDVALTISPIKDADGKIIGASKIARDITDRKLAAREREQLLEAERAARSEAERVSLLKDEFLANVSHELRTPLNAIFGWAQLLSSGSANDDDFKQGIESIERNARLQARLIEDLLDMSRIVSGKVRLDVQQTDLADVVEQAVSAARPSASARSIRLRQIIDPNIGPVAGDPNRLQQIVWNLIANAVKFTPKGGTIDVLLQRVNSHLEITVADSGAGIPADFLPHVFERFRQGDASSTRRHGGLGLGLAIVKQLVELHGGSVRAASEGEGRGSTFTVSLPLSPVRNAGRREHPATPSKYGLECDGFDLSQVSVLVVDDEVDARELIKRVLANCKADVFTATGAAEAFEVLKANRPTVLVSDIGMPEVDGYEFIRRVRRLAPNEGGHTPAIALTAFARSEDRTRAMIAGYQIHMSKPIEPQELLATVASLAGRTRVGEG